MCHDLPMCEMITFTMHPNYSIQLNNTMCPALVALTILLPSNLDLLFFPILLNRWICLSGVETTLPVLLNLEEKLKQASGSSTCWVKVHKIKNGNWMPLADWKVPGNDQSFWIRADLDTNSGLSWNILKYAEILSCFFPFWPRSRVELVGCLFYDSTSAFAERWAT